MSGQRSGLLLSEAVKLLTLPAVVLTTIATAATCVGMASLTAPSVGAAIAEHDPDLAPGVAPETVGLEWIGLGLIGIVIIGVICGSSEYNGSQVTTSLRAVPGRARLLWAKSVALSIFVLIVGAITIPALSVFSQIGLGPQGVINGGLPVSLVWRWLGGIALWLATALISMSLGLLLRRPLIPLLVMIVISQLTLPLVNLVPSAQYLPFAAGTLLFDPAMITSSSPAVDASTAVAVSTLVAWTVGALAVAGLQFGRRDAQE